MSTKKDKGMSMLQRMALVGTVEPLIQEPPAKVAEAEGAIRRSSTIEMGLGMTTQGMKIKELEHRLEGWAGAAATRLLDPKVIHPSKWANRDPRSFKSKEFAQLKDEIVSAGGNVQPIKVRPLAGKPGVYEIVFGHRRHRACLEVGLEVLCMIEDATDAELFTQMDRENRQREDLRPFEQGVMYAKALSDGLFPSMRKLADEIGIDAGRVSRYVSLAKLPSIVLDAFESPMDLQYDWASKLTQTLQENPERTVARAKVLCDTTPRFPAWQVFKKLVEEVGVVSHNTPIKRQIISGKTVMATVKVGRKGATTVDISVSLNADDRKVLETLLEDFLRERLNLIKPTKS